MVISIYAVYLKILTYAHIYIYIYCIECGLPSKQQLLDSDKSRGINVRVNTVHQYPEYEMEQIVNVKYLVLERQFLIKWKGYDHRYNRYS